MTIFLISLSISSSIMFTQLIQPLSLGLTLLLQTIIICLLSGAVSSSFWFSYILFLIFLGGMLILFIYITCIASNELFSISLNYVLMFVLSTCLLYCLLMFINPLLMNMYSDLPVISVNDMFISNCSSLVWIYNKPFMSLTVYIIVYLLLTLLIVVKILSFFKGPLRLKV